MTRQLWILALILTTGFGTAWVTVGVWLEQAVEHALHRGDMYETLRFRADGTAVVQYFLGARFDTWHYRDLDGQPLELPDNEQWLGGVYLAASPADGAAGEPVAWGHRLRSFADQQHPPHYWFFVSDGRADGRAYLVAYDSLTNARYGYLGTGGFREALPPEEQFPFQGQSASAVSERIQSLQYMYHWSQYPQRAPVQASPGELSPWTVFVQASDQCIYRVDLDRRSVRVVLEQPGLRSMGLLTVLDTQTNKGGQRLAVRLEDRVQILGANDQVIQQFAIPDELRSRPLNLIATTRNEALFYTTIWPDMLDTDMTYRLYWVDVGGRTSRRAEVLIRGSRKAMGLRALGGLIAPMPLLVDVGVCLARPHQLLNTGRADSWSTALAQALTEFWPSLVLAQLIGIVLAMRCWRRQVLYAAGPMECWLWTLFVLLFGLPGWIGYMYCRSWPRLERCPECGALVPRDRVTCARCATAFPLPAMKGTEVFA